VKFFSIDLPIDLPMLKDRNAWKHTPKEVDKASYLEVFSMGVSHSHFMA
jgi:hypothetical protein